MEKRGQIEVQFKWIFVLVVGVIIILFFSLVVFRSGDSAERSIDITVSKNFEGILSGAEVSSNTVNKIDIPDVRIEFNCDEYKIGEAPAQTVEAMNIFAPTYIKFKNLIAWTSEWNVPYRVTNFVYLTAQNVKYVFVKDNAGKAWDMYNTIPNETNKQFIDNLGQVSAKGDVKVRLVFFEGTNVEVPLGLRNVKDVDVTILKVNDNGRLDFYKVNDGNLGNADSTFHLGESSLIGAIFTDDFELYNCVMNNAFKKLNIVTKIYQGKVQNLISHYQSEGDQLCLQDYTDADNELTKIKDSSNIFNQNNIDAIKEAMITLDGDDGLNKRIELLSCALIY